MRELPESYPTLDKKKKQLACSSAWTTIWHVPEQ